jgi:hypothetical protein
VKFDRLQGFVMAYRLNPADNTLTEIGTYAPTDRPTRMGGVMMFGQPETKP